MITIKSLKIKHALIISLFFGAFQAIMPLIGWSLGVPLFNLIKEYTKWISFIILLIVGIKMIYESFKIEEIESNKNYLSKRTLVCLAIATSIDAFAVGFTFSNISIISPVIIIGLVTYFMSFIGVYIGNKFGYFFENKIEILGGLILIGIGIKMLFN